MLCSEKWRPMYLSFTATLIIYYHFASPSFSESKLLRESSIIRIVRVLSRDFTSTMNLVVVLAVFLFGQFCTTQANVVLIGNNITLSFDDIEANFVPAIKGSGECGVLYLAEPVDACSTLTNKVEQGTNYSSPFVLIIRGGCSFEEKVRRAQKAGFKAAIVYDNEDSSVLIPKGNMRFCWFVSLFVAGNIIAFAMNIFSFLGRTEIWLMQINFVG